MDTQLALCTFEQSERLKKAGFDWETFPYVYVVKNYTNWGKDHYVGDLVTNQSSDTSKYISAPTVELALQWIEQKAGIIGYVAYDYSAQMWYFVMKDDTSDFYYTKKAAASALLDELLTLIEEE